MLFRLPSLVFAVLSVSWVSRVSLVFAVLSVFSGYFCFLGLFGFLGFLLVLVGLFFGSSPASLREFAWLALLCACASLNSGILWLSSGTPLCALALVFQPCFSPW